MLFGGLGILLLTVEIVAQILQQLDSGGLKCKSPKVIMLCLCPRCQAACPQLVVYTKLFHAVYYGTLNRDVKALLKSVDCI